MEQSELYYVRRDGEQAGPYTLNQLRSMWSQGLVNLETLFWFQGMQDWQPLLRILHQLEQPSDESRRGIPVPKSKDHRSFRLTPSSPTYSDRHTQSQAGTGCAKWVITIFLIILVFRWISPDISHFKNSLERGENLSTRLLTKAQWRQKVRPYYNPGGGVQLTTIANFKALVGEPSSTQTVGVLDSFWYYDCSDGVIQVSLVNPDFTGGSLQIKEVNDY